MEEERLRCSRCGEARPSSEFGWKDRARGRRDAYCRPCRRAYGRAYYRANRDRRVQQDADRKRAVRLERTRLLLEHFAGHPCVDCGERDPLVLEFDHLRDKAFNIGQHLTHRSWQAVLVEIEKCEVVCANCHRRRTFARRGTVRLSLQSGEERAAGIEPVSFSLEG
jgi:hypothetical protein